MDNAKSLLHYFLIIKAFFTSADHSDMNLNPFSSTQNERLGSCYDIFFALRII